MPKAEQLAAEVTGRWRAPPCSPESRVRRALVRAAGAWHGASVWVSVQMRVCDQSGVRVQLLRFPVLEHSLSVARVAEGVHRITEHAVPGDGWHIPGTGWL